MEDIGAFLLSFGDWHIETLANIGFCSQYSIEIRGTSIAEYEWPNGTYWINAKGKAPQ